MRSLAGPAAAVLLLSMLATSLSITAPAAGGEPITDGKSGAFGSSVVPPFIDALDGVAAKGSPWDPDPANWLRTATVYQRGSPVGETEARIKLRIEGKGDPINSTLPQQTCLMTDDSGSMSWNDPNNMRVQGMQTFIDQLSAPDEIAHGAYAATLPSGQLAEIRQTLTTNYAGAKGAIGNYVSSGGTPIGNGLGVCDDELIPKKKAGFRWSILHLTDGCNNSETRDPVVEVNRMVQEGIRLFNIGLYPDPNSGDKAQCEPKLIDWSQQTGGKYYWVRNPVDLIQVYQDIAKTGSGSNDVAGKPPKTGAPMMHFKLTTDIEVVPNSFVCDSTSCTIPNPNSPATIIPGSKGVQLEWNAPVKELRIKQYWQVEFGIRAYTLGKQLKVNDIAQSFIEYDRYDGSPGGSDVLEQLYVDVLASPCAPSCLSRVEVAPSNASLKVGQMLQFSATAYDQNGRPMANLSFAWGVNGSAGSVAQSGMFTATEKGVARVWAEARQGNITRMGEAQVTVEDAAGDVSPPFVVTTNPPDGARDVALGTSIEVQWNESMDQLTAMAAFSSTPAVWCNWSWPTATWMVCTPASLNADTTYSVTIAPGASDLVGNQMVKEKKFSFTTAVPPDTTPPTIVHAPPGPVEEGTSILITAKVTDAVGVDSVRLNYRPAGTSGFTTLLMAESGGAYEATIPGREVVPAKVDYFIEALDAAGNRASSPDGAPSASHSVVVKEKTGGPGPGPGGGAGGGGGLTGAGAGADALLLGAALAIAAGALLAVLLVRRRKKSALVAKKMPPRPPPVAPAISPPPRRSGHAAARAAVRARARVPKKPG